MSRRFLNYMIVLLFVVLAAAVWSSERGVSGVMEQIGDTLSRLFN